MGMRESSRRAVVACALATAFFAAGCGQKYVKVYDSFDKPINCATARNDIRWLEDQKVSKATEGVEGMKFALPTTILIGSITGTAGAQYEVGSGEYNRKIDERIGDIKETCKLD